MNTCERCEAAPRAGRSPHCQERRAQARLDTKRRAGANYRARNRASVSAAQELYMDRNPHKRIEAWLRRYRITPAQYAALLELQGGGCALCGTSECQTGRRLSVDHDHGCCPESAKSCGKCVRGLLCHSCNSTLLAGYEALPVERQDSPYLNAYRAGRPLDEIGLD